MPLVGDLAEMQEQSCIGKTAAELNTDMPEGKVFKHAGWVVSKPIEVDGVVTPYAIRGKYDLLMEHPDGTFGIVDCKFQSNPTDKSNRSRFLQFACQVPYFQGLASKSFR